MIEAAALILILILFAARKPLARAAKRAVKRQVRKVRKNIKARVRAHFAPRVVQSTRKQRTVLA